MAYLVYEYGCLPPARGRRQALEQMLGRHRLWNALVAVEREYRSQRALTLRDEAADRELEALSGRLAGFRQEIKARRQAARKRNVDISDLKEGIARAKIDLASAMAAARRSRRARIEEQTQRLDQLEAERRRGVKQAQAESGLYWCNYDDVIAKYESARKRALREGRELRFQTWTGAGKVTVRYQQGLPAAQVHGADKRLQIDPVSPLAWTSPQRSTRRKLARSNVRIRTGSDGRTPVWLELPVVLHRPLPPDGMVRSASVVRDELAGRERWRLLITVSQADREAREGPAVAVDLGWRLLPQGLRVAYWEDEQGAQGELVLGPDVLWQFSKLNDLKAIRDHHLRAAVAELKRWLQTNEAPGWMDLRRVDECRDACPLLRIYREWRDRRIEGDAGVFGALTAWYERFRHLHVWEVNLRDQVVRHRKEVYRRFVAELLRTHGAVFLEELDIRSLARKDRPEDAMRNYTGSMRVVAAVSVLGRLFEERGGVVRVSAPNTTQQCSWCGEGSGWDAADGVLHCCTGCGRVFDQDRNAARNILLRGLAGVDGKHETPVAAEAAAYGV